MSPTTYPPMATLGFFAERLDPTEIDGILAIKPERSARKGEPLFPKSAGRTVPARIGTWFLSTEHKQLGGPAEHLDWLVTLALSHMAELRDKMPDLRADLSLLVFDSAFDPTDLPRDLLERAVRIGELEIEVPKKPADFFINGSNIHQFVSG